MIKVNSATLIGLEAIAVQIEVDIRSGLPCFEMVGLAGMAVRESRERVRAAIKNSGFLFPMQRITVNLAPAGIKKNGSLFDLPIAVGILAAMGEFSQEMLSNFFMAGELSLGGDTRAITGSLSLAELASSQQKSLLISAENANEAAAVARGVYPIRSLQQAQNFLQGKVQITPVTPKTYQPIAQNPSFAYIHGQDIAKRMLQIAAFGRHHSLIMGPPGSGKTLLAQVLPDLLSPLSHRQAIEVTKIYSAAGLLPPKSELVQTRPHRRPHHTISVPGLVGGGQRINPGEISLAHEGVLLLDELLEFSPHAIQALREPLEKGSISLTRANQWISFPANFLLVATTNPCPCGYLGDFDHECRCNHNQIITYQKKMTGPLLDRIDLFTFLHPLKSSDYQDDRKEQNRWNGLISHPPAKSNPNGRLTNKQVQQIPITIEAQTFLRKANDRLKLSARGHYKTLKVAKTIADLDQSKTIQLMHIAEALQYRWEALNIF